MGKNVAEDITIINGHMNTNKRPGNNSLIFVPSRTQEKWEEDLHLFLTSRMFSTDDYISV